MKKDLIKNLLRALVLGFVLVGAHLTTNGQEPFYRQLTEEDGLPSMTIYQVHQDKKGFIEDFLKIKDLAMKEKQLGTIQKWMNEKIEETYISVNQDSRDCNFSNKWLKK